MSNKKKAKSEITLVRDEYGDWAGLYVNGSCVHQNHSLDIHKVLGMLAKEFGFVFKDVMADGEWLEERGHLPQNFKEVKSKDE